MRQDIIKNIEQSSKKDFIFNTENLMQANNILLKYPANKARSALLPLLTLAQEQNLGWLSTACIEYIANFLDLTYMQVYEVASFYTMYNLKPVGKYHIQICTTTPCFLRGAYKIKSKCENKLNIKCNETSADGRFSLTEIECLGACVDAPVIQINNDYYENLSEESVEQLLDELSNKK